MADESTLPLWLPNAITGICTLLAGLGGVGLTLGITGKRQEAERKEQRANERRSEQRLALIDVLDAGHAWVQSQEHMFMVLSTVTDIVEIGKMESVDAHIVKRAAYSKALVGARLIVTDEVLAPMVKVLSGELDRTPEYGGALAESATARGRAETEVIGRSLAFLEFNKRLLEKLERTALERFSL